MRNLKKTLLIFLCAVMVLTFAACDNAAPAEQTTAPTVAATPTVDATPIPAETETPAPVATPAPTEDLGPPQSVFPLDDYDQQTYATLAPNATEITDETFAEIVGGFLADPSTGNGKLFILEGEFTQADGLSYLSRTLPDGTPCRLPMTYLEKAVEEGAWIRVLGIFNEEEVNGTVMPVLQVVTVEGLETPGQVQLPG